MSTQTDGQSGDLSAEIAQLRADFAKLSATLQQLATDRAGAVVGDAKEAAERLAGEVRRHTKSVTDEIEERPVTAALTAFGVGLILGILFNGRR